VKNFLHKLLRVPAPREIALVMDLGEQMGPTRADYLRGQAMRRAQDMGRAYAHHPANRVLSPKQRASINRANVRAIARQKAQNS
jgi:hypothetical protein